LYAKPMRVIPSLLWAAVVRVPPDRREITRGASVRVVAHVHGARGQEPRHAQRTAKIGARVFSRNRK
jgi:hypothetical protein